MAENALAEPLEPVPEELDRGAGDQRAGNEQLQYEAARSGVEIGLSSARGDGDCKKRRNYDEYEM